MDDELEVEIRDPDAGVAIARRRLADVAPPPPESEVAALDRVEQHRAVDRLRRHEGEGGVAFELGETEVRSERRDDRADEVRQDVLRVIELDVGEIPRVAGDVGDQETGSLRGWGHRGPLYGPVSPPRLGPCVACVDGDHHLASRYRTTSPTGPPRARAFSRTPPHHATHPYEGTVATVISVHSFRGGTGKSNTTANLAAIYAREGRRVGVIDTDIQSPGI